VSPSVAATHGPPWTVTVVVHGLMDPVHEISNTRKKSKSC
jgi:hypothetical protein